MAMAELHQTAGCIMEPDRYYIFDAEHGSQIVDQPRRGFRSIAAARDFLRFQEVDEGLFTIAQGRYAARA